MSGIGASRRVWIAGIVGLHLVISIVHGAAHGGAQVPLSGAASLFVFTVILAGPLAGVALLWPAERIGSWIVALTMAGSLVFGLANHFVFESPDRVAEVARQWQPLFAATAVLLALTEALGAGIAFRAATERTYAS